MNKIILIEKTEFGEKDALIFNNERDIKDYFLNCTVQIYNTMEKISQMITVNDGIFTREFALIWGKEVK